MKTFALTFLVIAIGMGCSPVRVVGTKQASDFRLSQYSTFDFVNTEIHGEQIPGYDQRIAWIKQEITRKLVESGLTPSTENPDLLVNIGIVIEEKVQTRETNYQDAPRYAGQRNYHWESQEVEVNRYNEGTVTVDFVDAAKKEMVWQGIASSVVARKQEESRKNITAGAEKLFETVRK